MSRNPTLAEPFRAILNAATPAVKPLPTIDGYKVVTHFIYPPIPIRSCDWSATLDGYEPGDPIGYGATEQAAFDDLMIEIEARS